MFNVIVIFIIMYEKLINETYEINELQYYTVLLYVRVRYHFVIRDSGPALKLKIPTVSTIHDSDVRTRPPDT
jgi:hypothetical protein